MNEALWEGLKALPLLRLPGRGECGEGATVKGAFSGEDLVSLSPSRFSSELDRALVRLSAGVTKEGTSPSTR